MEETKTTNKKAKDEHFLGAVRNLLESFSDKDEQFRNAIENSLGRMIDARSNETIGALHEFRQKNPKLPEQQIAIILRVIEKFTTTNTSKIDDENLSKIIDLCISDMVKNQDRNPIIQHPAVDTLVAIGRVHCTKVMDGLLNKMQQGHVCHFMILNCMGILATANISGTFSYIKPTLEIILPTLSMIKLDHVKQAYAFGIGRFAEAITEHIFQKSSKTVEDQFHAEIAIAYEVFLQQWLPNREPKVSGEILQALSHMYPLLSLDKISEQTAKLIPQILNFYRRSMDRNAITQLLSSVLKTSIETDPKSLDALSDTVINSLFDLVCVNPDYEKPQTVKGHYEVLRCFDLLVEIYSNKVLDMLLVQLRSNVERDRIKAFLVMKHLTNTFDYLISPKIVDFMPPIKQMMQNEKSFKIKMALLKTVVGFAQKDVVTDPEFVRFMLRNSLHLTKITPENGTVDEHTDLIEACNNSLYILASTVRTIDILMKQVLLEHYLMLEYTDVCGNIAKCLAQLFMKSTDPIFMVTEDPDGDDAQPKNNIPSPESVFIRSVVLLGNPNELKRNEHILSFLKYYCPIIDKRLPVIWKEKLSTLAGFIAKEEYLDQIYDWLTLTINAIDEEHFTETLVMKTADQIVLYPFQTPLCEYKISKFSTERGMLLKTLGICLCHVNDNQTVEAKIDLIINTARQEKIEKSDTKSYLKLLDACEALGFASQTHSTCVLKKLDALIQADGSRKSTGTFFSGLNFIKDSSKEIEIYKHTLLAIESYSQIIQKSPQSQFVQDADAKILTFLFKQYSETKDFLIRNNSLQALLILTKQILHPNNKNYQIKLKSTILAQILKFDYASENLPLLPLSVKLATNLLNHRNDKDELINIGKFVEELCRKIFTIAQELKVKFESNEEDERNSYLAKYLNLTLPELNLLVKAIFDRDSTPGMLDDVNSVLEYWVKDMNNEVRICSSHVMNNALEVYMKTVKVGCEAPSKFNQNGSMLAKIVPRCIDSNATVRQTSIEILKKILEISCIYESLTIADETVDWIQDLQKIKEEIVTDDAKEIYRIANDIARIIAQRLSSFQYLHFCKTLLLCINDVEQSSAIGASVVLKFFIQLKGTQLFHAIPDYVKDALKAASTCQNDRARTGVLKALVALTKHHPKLVCSEILEQTIPYESNVVGFWKTVAGDVELFDVILDNFLTVLSSSCLYEPSDSDHPQLATTHPFAIFCALREMVPCKEIKSVLKQKFPEVFCMLLTSLAVYTNLSPPTVNIKSTANVKSPTSNSKMKFGFAPNKEVAKMNPCQVILDTFQEFLDNLEMEQISAVLSVYPNLATSPDLNHFMEILTPMATSLVNQLGSNSSFLRQIISVISKYVASPYDSQRIAAIGLYSQIVPLRPSGEIASVIMLHLSSALSDPNPLVRGFCIRGFAYIGHLTEHDINKYSETCLSALMKGIDDSNPNCFINIPLESIRGLSKVLISMPGDKLENVQISLTIRIRPFYENTSIDIREAAILLFGDVCDCGRDTLRAKNDLSADKQISDALKEQLFSNLFPMLLHLSESNSQIVKACKATLRKLATLLNAPKVNTMIQSHLLDHGHLNYDLFILNLMKIIAEELQPNIMDFIESCLPYLKSSWPEIRGNAASIIGSLHNANKQNQLGNDSIGQKIANLLKDEQVTVRIKAANALGFMFGNII